MSKATSNVNITADTFQSWVDKTNELRYALNTELVNANSTLGNTSGNCHVRGFFAANTLVACANIGGGSIAANSSSLPEISFANAVFVTNTVHTCNTFFQPGTVVTDAAAGIHSNTHVFNADVTTSANLIVGKIVANGVMGSNLQVISTDGNTTYWRSISEMVLVDSVTNTNIDVAATARSVATAYSAATANVFTVDKTFSASVVLNGPAVVVGSSTTLVANGSSGSNGLFLTSNGSTIYWATVPNLGGTSNVQVLDSVTNTSIVFAATSNSAKTAYDAAILGQNMAISANTRAASAQTAVVQAQSDALNANTRAASAQTAAIAAFSNATAFSANASNITSGTLNTARLSGTYSISITGSANSVLWTNVTNRPTDLSAFTNGPGYITQASSDTAYANATSFASNANNITSGTLAAARLSGSYSISVTGSAGSVPWTGVTGRPTDLASFTNGPGYVTSSGSVTFATNAGTASVANAVDFNNVTNATAVLRNVSTGYTGSARVFTQTATPASPIQGDLWLQI